MNSITPAAFGLASAASWGAGDFSGGLAARRASVFTVAMVAKVASLTTMVVCALARAESLPNFCVLAWAGAAGVAGAVGLVSLYQALAVGVMGIAAPVSAVIAAAMPVLFAAVWQGTPNGWQTGGFALAFVGVWFVSRPGEPVRAAAGGGVETGADASAGQRGLTPAILAGIGFGGFYVLISRAHADSVFWPLAASQLVTLATVLAAAGIASLARRDRSPRVRGGGAGFAPGRLLGLMLLAGVLDAGGNAFFLLAEHAGRLDVAAVLASLYPASTVVLARVLLNERVTRTQAVGIAAALVSIPLIAG